MEEANKEFREGLTRNPEKGSNYRMRVKAVVKIFIEICFPFSLVPS